MLEEVAANGWAVVARGGSILGGFSIGLGYEGCLTGPSAVQWWGVAGLSEAGFKLR